MHTIGVSEEIQLHFTKVNKLVCCASQLSFSQQLHIALSRDIELLIPECHCQLDSVITLHARVYMDGKLKVTTAKTLRRLKIQRISFSAKVWKLVEHLKPLEMVGAILKPNIYCTLNFSPQVCTNNMCMQRIKHRYDLKVAHKSSQDILWNVRRYYLIHYLHTFRIFR